MTQLMPVIDPSASKLYLIALLILAGVIPAHDSLLTGGFKASPIKG